MKGSVAKFGFSHPVDNRDQQFPRRGTHNFPQVVYAFLVSRTNINIDASLVRKARKLTTLKTKRQIVNKALELLVRSESRKAILRYYGSGIWKGELKASRRSRI